MIVHPADRRIVQWAIERGYLFSYVREHGLPEPCLRVCLGQSSAFFKAGRLVHWLAQVDARRLDLLMFELTSLFGFCSSVRALPPQQAVLSRDELLTLIRGGSDR